MKKRIAPIALSVCAIVLAAVFAVSCSSEFEPAWKASGGKATLSIRLGKPDSPSASPRLIVQNGGYLYIQTGHDEGTAVLYGPWKVSAGDTFTTTDIPAGTYSAMHIFYMAEPLPDSDPIIPIEDMTFGGELGSRLEAYEMTLDSVSLATITDVTIIEGTTNVLKATLLPATTRYVDASGPLHAAHSFTDSPDSRERLFIQLTSTSFAIDIYERLASLDVTIRNNSASVSASLFYVALYRADGSFVSGQQISSSTITPGSVEMVAFPYSGGTPDSLFLYVEYQGSEMQITAINRDIQELPQYEYFVSNGGEGTGRTAGNTCSLETAIASIQDATYITAAHPATIYITNNITVSPSVAYGITRPTRITSAAGGPYNITIGESISGSLFLVDHATQNPSLTMDNITVVGSQTIRALQGLVLIERGSCVLGNNATLYNNWSQEDGYGGAVTVNNAASSLVMNSGSTITYCRAPYGGGVRVNAGEFRMIDGEISECWSYNNGAGIYMLDGTLRIEGGSIESNTTYSSGYGGGVYLDGGTCQMTNGSIGQDDNPNRALHGAGVYVHNASFTFSGGRISYNRTITSNSANGAGVYVYGESRETRFSMPAGSTGQISSNELWRVEPSGDFGGGGLSVFGVNAIVNLNGGMIGGATLAEGNTTYGNANGGGVFIYDGLVYLGGTRIQNNFGQYGGGIYISASGSLFLVTGIPAASILSNRSYYDGGGLYQTMLANLYINTGVDIDSVIQSNTADGDPATAQYYVP